MLSEHDLVLYRRIDRLERRVELLEQEMDRRSRDGDTSRRQIARNAAAIRQWINSWTGQKDLVLTRKSSSSAATLDIQ